jgi:hypothetical protein
VTFSAKDKERRLSAELGRSTSDGCYLHLVDPNLTVYVHLIFLRFVTMFD